MTKIEIMKERLLEFVRYTGLPVYQFEKLCGLSNAYIKNMSKGIGADKLDNILNKFPELNKQWLLYGEGNMLVEQSKKGVDSGAITAEGLPLIPIDAVAGFNGVDVQGVRLEDCSRYVVPEFAELHAEYMIRVSGSSMYPKYSNGDLLACRRVQEVTFLQWGKVYVLDSNQGAMVKRLFPCEDSEVVECRSDNPNYPPFRLPKSEIRSVSIVVGVIRFE